MKVTMIKDYPLNRTEVLKKGKTCPVGGGLAKILFDGGYAKKAKEVKEPK